VGTTGATAGSAGWVEGVAGAEHSVSTLAKPSVEITAGFDSIPASEVVITGKPAILAESEGVETAGSEIMKGFRWRTF
jgi:hypothetical protein